MSTGARGSTNGRTSNQDYTNLLFSDSDSDSRVPDLKLPPVKGKRQKKKRGSSGYRGEEASCGIGSLMKVFLLLILFTVVAALGGISFWSMQKISSLQEKVDKLEQSDAFTHDSMTKFQTQLMSLNKTLTDVHSGTAGRKTLIEELKSKVKALEYTSNELKSLAATSNEMDLQKRFKDLLDVIADLNATAITITSKQESLSSRLSALENNFNAFKGPDTDSGKTTQPDDQYMEQFNLLNQTTKQALASIKLRQDQQETDVSKIKELISTSATSSPASISHINELVEDAMLEYVSNMTVPGSLPTGQVKEVLKQVDIKMEAMKKELRANQDNTAVTKGEFLLFKDIVHSSFENVNKSILILNDDLDSLTKHFPVLNSYMNTSKVNQVAGGKEGEEEKVIRPKEGAGVVTPNQSEGVSKRTPSPPFNSKETTPIPSMTSSTTNEKSTKSDLTTPSRK